MQAQAKPTDQAFLVRVNGEQFLFEVTGDDVTGTNVPSAAAHFDYAEADRMCQRLLDIGHPAPCVCNLFGFPVTIEEIRNMPTVVTDVDWTIFRGLAAGEDHASIAKKIGITVPQLRQRIPRLNEKFDAVLGELHKSNVEKHAFTDQLIADTEAKRSSRQ